MYRLVYLGNFAFLQRQILEKKKKAQSVDHISFIHSAVYATELLHQKTGIITPCISLWNFSFRAQMCQNQKYNFSQSLPSNEIQDTLADTNGLRVQDSLADN